MKNGSKCGGTKIGWILVLVGALNWGLVGIGMLLGGDWNVVNLILGKVMWLEAIVYILVGLAGVMMLCGCKCTTCKAPEAAAPEANNMGGGEHHEG